MDAMDYGDESDHDIISTEMYVKLLQTLGTKAINTSHQAQKGFCGIYVGITQHQKVYLVYIPSSRKIISSYDVVFDESFFSELECTSQPYLEAMAMRPTVTPFYTSSR